jgi:hypothetical protein
MLKCNQIRETFFDTPTPEVERHLAGCPECARELASLRATMAAMDDWRMPEPSPFFGTRLKARLADVRNEPVGWLAWLRKPMFGIPMWRPALASAFAVVLAVGAALMYQDGSRSGGVTNGKVGPIAREIKGTAVGDLLVLEKEQELFTQLDLLDDLNGGESHQNEL